MTRSGRVEYVNDFTTVLRKMEAGRASAAIMTPWIYLYHFQQSSLANQLQVLPIKEVTPTMLGLYLSSTNLSDETVRAVARALDGMIRDGSVRAIYGRYLPAPIVANLFVLPTSRLSAYLTVVRSVGNNGVPLAVVKDRKNRAPVTRQCVRADRNRLAAWTNSI